MRTPEQIKNLRRAFISMFGLVGMVVSDEFIEAWFDKVQESINKRKYQWEVRVRIKGINDKLEWEAIEPEPKVPIGSFDELSRLCNEELKKQPDIDSIQITERKFRLDVHIFEQTIISSRE